jgi:hypothetical protein
MLGAVAFDASVGSYHSLHVRFMIEERRRLIHVAMALEARRVSIQWHIQMVTRAAGGIGT